MPISRKEAEELGLEIHRLLTWDFEAGHPRRTAEGEVVTHLVYGLDDFQIATKVHKREMESVPPDVITDASSGLPLRPMYIGDGLSKRAVPISWNEGVDFIEWRYLKE
jgi:hypothetical protein